MQETDAPFTPEQLDLLMAAWATSRDGNGIVIEPWAFPAADDLAERGWLERRFVTDTGEMCWFWTGAAETAFDLNDLLTSHEGRQN